MAIAVNKVRPATVLAAAAVVGILGGLLISYRQRVDERDAFEASAEKLRNLNRHEFPVAAQPPAPKATGPGFNLAAVAGVPPYPGAVPADLLSQPAGTGSDMQLVWFMTDDPVDAVIGFYERKFAEDGIQYKSHFYGEGAAYVGYLDMKDSEKMHMVVALRQGQRTVVMPSSSYPKKLVEGNQKLPPEVPEYPDTTARMVLQFDERSLATQSFVASVEGKSVDEIFKWYQGAFKEKGWVIAESAIGDDGEGKIVASRPPRQVTVTLRRQRTSVTVYMNLSG